MAKNRTGARARARCGFALVIALSLMAFVLLLVLSLSSLVRVESASSEIAKQRMAARQNALLSVQIAVGELQRMTGPDARVTAPAARLDPNPEDPGTAASDVAQPRWTGVWRNPVPATPGDFGDGVDPAEEPKLLGWLVSAPEGASPDPEAGPAGGELVRLAPAVEASSADPDEAVLFDSPAVEVPLVSFDGGRSAYAYWVDDEGAKAKLTAVAENFDPSEPPLVPLGNGVRAFPRIEGDLATESGWLPPPPPSSMELLFSARAESMAEPGATAAELVPHATLEGFGVQADALRGGLKFDLSAITQMDEADFESEVLPHLPGKRIYGEYLEDSTQPGIPADDGKGPVWDLLRQWGDLSEGAAADSYPVRTREDRPDTQQGGGLEIVESPGVFPVVKEIRLYMIGRLSGDLSPLDVNFATYRPRLYYLPSVTLWNPHDKALVAEEGYEFTFGVSGNDGWGHFYAPGTFDGANRWEPFDDVNPGDSVNGVTLGRFPYSHGRGMENTVIYRLRGSPGADEVVIPPGESRVFTMNQNVEREPASASSDSLEVELTPGFRNFGYYLDAIDTFRVLRDQLEEPGFQGIYLDLRSRVDRLNSNWVVTEEDAGNIRGLQTSLALAGAVDFNDFDEMIDSSLQQIRWIRLEEGRLMARRQTITELSHNPPKFTYFKGQDWYGSEPFFVRPGDLREGTIPAKDASDSVAIGYDIGMRIPEPNVALHDAYEPRGIRPFASNNARAAINEGPWENQGDNNEDYHQMIVFENTRNNAQANQTYRIETWNAEESGTYLGFSDTSSGVERFSLFHLPGPGDAFYSVGQLRQLDFVGNDGSLNTQANGLAKLDGGPAFVLGEARADPYIPLNDIEAAQNANRDSRHVDHQWLANRQVWDRFFASSVPASGAVTFPLESGRVRPVGGTTAPNPPDPVDLRDSRRSAAELWVDGAFNVNSVSVPAWRALLAQYLGRPVPLASGGESASANAAPYIDLPVPLAGPFTGGNSSAPGLYQGFLRLTDDQIDELARAIVRLIKERGPFTSLADFINRSVDPDDAVGLPSGATPAQLAEDPRVFGLLQAALERTGLNEDLVDDYYVDRGDPPWDDFSGGDRVSLPAVTGAFMEGAPGYWTQGKLLQRLGSLLSARSDTFTVRGYGEVRDPVTGEPMAEARCEAVVQRMPEFVDAGVPAETRIADLPANSVNRAFGRRYRIVSFRWLDDSEL